MYKHKFVIISFLFVSLILFSALDAGAQEEQDAEIAKLIREVSVDTQKGAISNYTYLMKFSFERHKKLAGRKFTRLYEAILPSKFATNKVYAHQILLIQDSEQKLTPEDIMIARQNLAKELERAEKEADNSANQTQTFEDGGYWTTSFKSDGKKIKVDIMKLLESSKFANLQRKIVDGRNIATIDFTPKADAVLEKTLAYLAKLEGQLVINETDKRIVRIEGFALGEFANLKDKPEAERQKELVFLFTQTKVSEGFWFPQTIWLNFGKHPEIFDAIEIQYNFSSYKKASVDVKDTIDTPKEPNETNTEVKQN
jgi:hypothetical protein